MSLEWLEVSEPFHYLIDKTFCPEVWTQSNSMYRLEVCDVLVFWASCLTQTVFLPAKRHQEILLYRKTWTSRLYRTVFLVLTIVVEKSRRLPSFEEKWDLVLGGEDGLPAHGCQLVLESLPAPKQCLRWPGLCKHHNVKQLLTSLHSYILCILYLYLGTFRNFLHFCLKIYSIFSFHVASLPK